MLLEESTAGSFMSRNLVKVYSDSNASKAVRLMVEHNIGCVIVEDSEGIAGLFTERDLISNVLGRGRRIEEPIIMGVMTRSFNVLRPDATLTDTAKMMKQKKGRLVVFDDGVPLGIVTATDIVREIYRFGRTFDFVDAYSKEVLQEGPKVELEQIVRIMDERRIGSVLISEGRMPRAIFTERDLLRAVLSPDFRFQAKVGEFATQNVVTADEAVSGLEAAAIMARHNIKRLPLTKSGEIVGIVTARDLVDGFASSQ